MRRALLPVALLCGASACLDFGALQDTYCADAGWPECRRDSLVDAGGGGDAGSADAGLLSGSCSSWGTCAPGEICDLGLQRCRLGAPCFGPGLSTCTYGQLCAANRFSTRTCGDPAAPTCPAFSQQSPHTSGWSPSQAGAVIFASDVRGRVAANCVGDAGHFAVNISAYAQVAWPMTAAELPTAPGLQLHAVGADGTEFEPSFTPSSYTVDDVSRHASFTVNFCVPGSSNSYTAALHFADGNEVCIPISY